jgi:PadR family transcriptional regulator, regulator of vanillate utilization
VSLRTSLLCVLTAQPMTGYELAKQFGASVAHLWHAPHSQIYPELRRLEADGLVVATAVPRGRRAVKRSYAITDAGRAEVARWVAEVAPVPRPREADYVKASYLEFVAPQQARAQFEALRDHHRAMHAEYTEHLAELEAGRTSLMQARFEATPAGQHEAIVAYKVHVYRGLAARAQLQAAWAEEGLALVDRLAGPPDG